jgi:NTP pyrophosphatase (non-canonical NTP hydrolase)
MNIIRNIEKWVTDRHLHTSKPETQYVKFQEEAGELASDLCRNRDPRDSIGDIGVTLISLSLSLGVDFIECLEIAYNQIKDRKGKLINGVFVKEADLSG